MNEYYYNNLDIDIGDGVEDDESFYDDGRKRKKAGLVIGFDPLEKISQKQRDPKQEFQPIFTNASLLLSQKVSKSFDSILPVDSISQSISNTISSQQASSEIYNFYHQKAIVANTEKSNM
ncbi:1336_t:CDS:2 [Entrophospora sp. SA101]|nr:1972_t:CDS:2 [Entrophospora sp. SA101]CAJ0837006.1 1336_t:CDS:2 [Entrophospora sp. SA101]